MLGNGSQWTGKGEGRFQLQIGADYCRMVQKLAGVAGDLLNYEREQEQKRGANRTCRGGVSVLI
jgi:hypothetical protein